MIKDDVISSYDVDLVDHEEFATMEIGPLLFGVPVAVIQDILAPTKVAHVPLTSDDIKGVINLRGRIVTVIDLSCRLKMSSTLDSQSAMNVVVEFRGESYSLLVERVGDVISIPVKKFEKNPPTLQMEIARFSKGIYRLQDKLLVVLDVAKILTFSENQRL